MKNWRTYESAKNDIYFMFIHVDIYFVFFFFFLSFCLLHLGMGKQCRNGTYLALVSTILFLAFCIFVVF